MSIFFQYLDEFGTYSNFIQNPSNLLPHLLDLTGLFLAMILTTMTTLGWGQILRKITGLSTRNQFSSIDIWLGVLIISIFVELINFWLPISWLISCAIIAIGLFMLALNPGVLTSLGEFFKRPWIFWITPFILILAFVLGSKALYTPWSGDNILYHLNTIRWLNEFPTVPGLGNLHGRLAFNQSYFSFLAPLNIYPYFKHAPALGNVFFITLALLTALEILFTKITFKLVIFIGLFIAITKHADTLHSTNSNFIIALLQAVIFSQLITLFNQNDDKDLIDRICTTIYLCLLIFIFKFSSAAYAAATIGIVAFRFRKNINSHFPIIRRTLFMCALILGIHMVRGYLLSGVPFYPSTAFHIGTLPWSVDLNEIQEEARWVMSWARTPGPRPEEVLGNWNWLLPWMKALPINFVATIALSIFFFIATLVRRPSNQYPQNGQLIYIPLLSSLIFWFLAAPAIEFVGNIPELLATLSIWLFCCHSAIIQKFSKSISDSSKYSLLISLVLCCFAIKSAGIKRISLEGWMPIKERALALKETRSGLKVLTPVYEDQCGDSALPCTPYLDQNLRLLGPKIEDGFSKKLLKPDGN